MRPTQRNRISKCELNHKEFTDISIDLMSSKMNGKIVAFLKTYKP